MPEESNAVAHLVLDVVCKKFGVAKMSVLGAARTKTRVRARQAVYYILRTEFMYSYPEIGLVTNRDHTTVMCAIPAMSKRMEVDSELHQNVNECIAEIRKVRAISRKNEVICVAVSNGVHKRLAQLLKTGMYGVDLGEVVERLVCQQLQGLKVSK